MRRRRRRRKKESKGKKERAEVGILEDELRANRRETNRSGKDECCPDNSNRIYAWDEHSVEHDIEIGRKIVKTYNSNTFLP